MNEMKLAVWRFSSNQLPATINAAAMLDIDLSSHPGLVDHIADWTPVSHTLDTVSGTDELMLTVLLVRTVAVPDDASGV